MPVELADSHVHLDRYTAGEVTDILGKARKVGVTRFLAVSTSIESSKRTVTLARRRGVLTAVGVHPSRIGGLEVAPTMAIIERLARVPGVAAIGETGFNDDKDLDLQEQFFVACLRLAASRDLGIVLHVLGDHDRAISVLAREGARRVVVHYFQGDAALAGRYLELGCYISVGKPATRPENEALRAAVAGLPLDRLMVETDTYPAPGRTTEPRDVVGVAAAVAQLQGVAADVVHGAAWDNFKQVFGRPRRP